MQKITTFFWFDANAEEAVNFYCSIFNNSKVLQIHRCSEAGPGPKGSVLLITFQLEGQTFMALNGGPMYKFTEAISLYVDCQTQEEVDEYWTKLTGDGGSPIQCGWLKDKFGLCWQIIPRMLTDYLCDPDAEKAGRAMKAMMDMVKIDIAALKKAYTG